MINQNHLSLLCFDRRWDTRGEGIIIGDNPAGHCFLLRYLIPAKKLFQIIDDCETENVH